MNPAEYPTQPAPAPYNVKATIMGAEDEGNEIVGTGYPTRAAAVSAAKAMQANIPDPAEGDVIFYAERA
jgi:hypothetical protein